MTYINSIHINMRRPDAVPCRGTKRLRGSVHEQVALADVEESQLHAGSLTDGTTAAVPSVKLVTAAVATDNGDVENGRRVFTSPPLRSIQTVPVSGRYIVVDHALTRMERDLSGLIIVESRPTPDIFDAPGGVAVGGGH